MKYHNFKKVLAAFLAAALTVGSTAFVASATEAVGDITYTLAGASSDGKGGGDYVVDVDAVGGLINIGAITVEYDADLYSDVTFTPAENIVDASLFWGVGEQTAGEFTFAFSSDNADDDVADLFAVDNPSGTIAYIDATNAVNIGTLTFKFADDNTYASTFTTKTVVNNTITATAQNILHAKDGYDTSKQDAEIEITNTLVFTADDFTVEDTEATYKANTPQAPSVGSSVAEEFTLALGDDGATEVINADTYAIKVVDVSGEGYYDADEIDLGANFVIKQAEVTITAPADPEAVNYVAPDGYDLANLKIEGWKIVTTGKLDAGTYDIEVKYAGELDTANNIYIYNENEVTSADEITATVELVVNKIAGEVPALENPAAVTYNAEVAQTVTGYEVELSEGWKFVDANAALAIGENKDIAVKFVPDDATNYEYEGYDETLGYVSGKVTVIVNKAKGTAPEAPVVNKTEIRLDAVGGEVAITEFVTPGVWSTDVEKLAVGKHTVNYTYKPADQNKYDYSECEGWNNETKQFEYSVKVEVLKPYLKDLVVPPTAPDAKDFAEGTTYKYSDFALAAGWVYASPDTTVENAGTIENVKVLYTVQADYDVDPADGYTVEDGKIVSYVDITVNKIVIPDGTITFAQESVYTGSAIVLDTANIKVTGLTGVDAEDVTLTAVTDVNVGTYDVYATVAETANYNAKESFKIGTLTITPADVTADKFTLEYTSVKYDGTAKKPAVTPAEGVAAPTVKYYNAEGTEVAEPTALGEYTVKVSAAASGNYKAYTDFAVGKFVIEKGIIPEGKITFAQSSTFNNTEVTLDKANLVIDASLGITADEITLSVAGNAAAIDVGTYNVVAKIDSANYETVENYAVGNLTINKATVTKDMFNVTDLVHTYDGEKKYATITLKDEYIRDGEWLIGKPKPNQIQYLPTGTGFNGDEVRLYALEVNNRYEITVIGGETTNYEDYLIKLDQVLVINQRQLTVDNFKVVADNFKYNGEVQKPLVEYVDIPGDQKFGEVVLTFKQGDAVVAEPKNAGTYDVYATVAETGTFVDENGYTIYYNYIGFADKKIGEFTIGKGEIEVNKPANLAAVDYIPGGVVASGLTFPENWVYADAEGKKLEAGENQAITVKYNKAFDTVNYDYVAGEGVTGDITAGFTSTVNVTVNKIAGTVPALTKTYEATYDANKADKKVGEYVTVAENVWTLVNADAVLEYKDNNTFAVETVVDTKNYTYEAEGITVGDGKLTAEITVKFNKAQGTVPALTKTYEATYDAEKADKKVATYITIADAAWKLADANVVLEYKDDNKYAVEYATNTVDYEYPATEGVTVGEGKLTAEITVKFNKAAGTVTAPTAPAELTYDNTKADKKVTTYIASFGEGWTVADAEAVLAYGDNPITVKYTTDTANYTYEGYTVADGYITTTVAVKFNKAALPADAATVTAKSTEYTASAITVDVVKNAAYNGLGEFTVAYPDGNINVGTYDVTATFTEGDNYLGGTVTFTNALTITKQVLQNISGPTFDKTEAIVGEEIKNDAGEGFKFAEDYVIKEGNNEIKVTKTIDGDFAKNYDYTVAAEKVGLTVSIDETTGDVTLTKTFNVIGKYATGTVSLKAIAIDGAPMEGITVTVTPETGEATTLTFTTNENEIIVDKAELTAGKYTIKVKMLKYLEYTINFTLEGGAALDLGSVDLIAGDIVGGPAGQETFGDGVIDIDDFVIAIRAFDTESSNAVKDAADINGDRANNVTDLGYIKANFNKTTADCIKTID